MTIPDLTRQRLIIDSINFTVGKRQYQIELETGHVWDISDAGFDETVQSETGIYLTGDLSSMIQDCLFRIAEYEKHENDWYNQSDEEEQS
jgi:hypothetical protein